MYDKEIVEGKRIYADNIIVSSYDTSDKKLELMEMSNKDSILAKQIEETLGNKDIIGYNIKYGKLDKYVSLEMLGTLDIFKYVTIRVNGITKTIHEIYLMCLLADAFKRKPWLYICTVGQYDLFINETEDTPEYGLFLTNSELECINSKRRFSIDLIYSTKPYITNPMLLF